jgi:hypothetical protein
MPDGGFDRSWLAEGQLHGADGGYGNGDDGENGPSVNSTLTS